MKKILKNLTALLVFVMLASQTNQVWAGFLKFNSTTATAENGGSFSLSVTVDPGSDEINSSDVYITYDQTLLSVTSVSAGTMFPTVSNDTSVGGKIYIAGMVDDPASSISSAGTIATINFKALKEGSGSLDFDCSSSKIIKNDINATNVIVCSQNVGATVTVGSGGTTADPTATPVTNPPSELPQTGIIENLAKFSIPGMILLLLGVGLRLVL